VQLDRIARRSNTVKTWLREPLLHFLLAGGLLFAVYGWLERESADAPRTVRISAAEINWLEQTWTRQWSRPPTEEERRGLVTGYLKEVLLAHEAAELGLDENDTIIRRRLAQKMEFLVQDTARLAEPDDELLRRFYAANQARYQTPARVSFSQIFYRQQAAAREGLLMLAERSPDVLGDPSMLERNHADTDVQAVSSQFGDAFSRAVFGGQAGRWHGPVASAYGFHLVRVSARHDAQPLPYEAARAQVLEDWQREEQARAGARFFADLLKKYDVVVDERTRPLLGRLTGDAG
jgi:hypothetical protein